MIADCCICCQFPFYAGCYDRCATLVISATVPAAGEYTLKADFNGKTTCITVDLAADDPLAFPLQGLNEYYTFQAAIFDADGKRASIDDGRYDCIKFSTKPGCTLNAAHDFTVTFP